MLFTMYVLESVGLKVQKLMILWIDNKGAVDLFNNWSVAGWTHHIGAWLNFMRELKEQGVLEVKWIVSEDNNSNMFTKNLSVPPFEKHMKAYVTDEKIDQASTKGRVSEWGFSLC